MIHLACIRRCSLVNYKKSRAFEFVKLSEQEQFKLKGIFAPRIYYIFLAPLIYLMFLALYRVYTKKLITLKWRKIGFRATIAFLCVFTLLTLFNLVHAPFMLILGPIYTWLYFITDINFNLYTIFNFGSLFILVLSSFNLYYLIGGIYE